MICVEKIEDLDGNLYDMTFLNGKYKVTTIDITTKERATTDWNKNTHHSMVWSGVFGFFYREGIDACVCLSRSAINLARHIIGIESEKVLVDGAVFSFNLPYLPMDLTCHYNYNNGVVFDNTNYKHLLDFLLALDPNDMFLKENVFCIKFKGWDVKLTVNSEFYRYLHKYKALHPR